MKKKLTLDQEFALRLMIEKGGGMTAAATRDAWEKGESYYIDARNPLRGKGIMRYFNRGNRDAVKVQPRDHYKERPAACPMKTCVEYKGESLLRFKYGRRSVTMNADKAARWGLGKHTVQDDGKTVLCGRDDFARLLNIR